MTTTNRWLGAAAAAGILALAAPAAADTPGNPEGNAAEIRVVNNHLTQVRVYVEDAAGHLHNLGRVARGQFKALPVAEEITDMGPVQVKFFPAEPSWSPMADDAGIRTQPLELAGHVVTAFLEPTLPASIIRMDRGAD